MVPDASVILKWVLQTEGEGDVDAALAILADFESEKVEIVLPALWRYEVGNILGLKQPQEAKEAMAALLGYEFEEVIPDLGLCGVALDLMRQVPKISFYDASYVALARREDGICVTADERLVGRVAHLGHVSLVKDWR